MQGRQFYKLTLRTCSHTWGISVVNFACHSTHLLRWGHLFSVVSVSLLFIHFLFLTHLRFFNLQCFIAISSWAKIRPDVIAGDGSREAKRKRLRDSIIVAVVYWNKSAGILRPFKTTPILNDFLMTTLSLLDLSVPIDLRDSLFFNLAFVSGSRAMEACNITWKDVTILGRGEAVLIHIRPSKNPTILGSNHSAQFGRRTRPEVSKE